MRRAGITVDPIVHGARLFGLDGNEIVYTSQIHVPVSSW
jgi:hypothetical protein